MRLLMISILSLLFLALQCDKDKDEPDSGNGNNQEQLPPATQTGKNTFGCLVNGEVWRPENNNFNDRPIGGGYGRSELLITANKEIKETKTIDYLNQIITIHLPKEGNELKTHVLNGSNYPEKYAKFVNQNGDYPDSVAECRYITDSLNGGYIKITRLDSAENIVSGEFEFTAVNDTCGQQDTMRITKGRFDIKYAY